MTAQQDDGRNTKLRQSHGNPGALDNDDGLSVPEVVPTIEERVPGQSRREDPLTELSWLQASSGVAQRVALWVVQPYGDASLEHSPSVVGTCLEALGGLWRDPLARQERMGYACRFFRAGQSGLAQRSP